MIIRLRKKKNSKIFLLHYYYQFKIVYCMHFWWCKFLMVMLLFLGWKEILPDGTSQQRDQLQQSI